MSCNRICQEPKRFKRRWIKDMNHPFLSGLCQRPSYLGASLGHSVFTGLGFWKSVTDWTKLCFSSELKLLGLILSLINDFWIEPKLVYISVYIVKLVKKMLERLDETQSILVYLRASLSKKNPCRLSTAPIYSAHSQTHKKNQYHH